MVSCEPCSLGTEQLTGLGLSVDSLETDLAWVQKSEKWENTCDSYRNSPSQVFSLHQRRDLGISSFFEMFMPFLPGQSVCQCPVLVESSRTCACYWSLKYASMCISIYTLWQMFLELLRHQALLGLLHCINLISYFESFMWHREHFFIKNGGMVCDNNINT